MFRIPDRLVEACFEPAWDLYEGSVRLRTLRQLRRSQWLPREALLAIQRDGLRRMLRHAADTSPFYRERFAAAGVDVDDIDGPADLHRLPLLTKDDIREHRERMVSEAFTPAQLQRGKTGGSTGVSLEFYCDHRAVQQRNGAALRTDEWSGWRLGQPIGAVWGNPPVPRTLKNKLRAWLKERVIYLDTMKIDDAAIDAFARQWRAERPGLLYGHAHSIFILAENLLARGVVLRPRGIVSTSMMLIDSERQVIEEAFGIPVTNRYGCEEVSLIASECEVHRGLHLNIEQKVVEFLRDDGTPCAPGEDGRIVVTDLLNRGMPVIRYEVGDRGVPSDRVCSCGRGLPLMESLTGRTADFLLAQNGSRVAGISLIENTLTHFPGIRQLQIVQEAPLELEVRLVPAAGYGPEVEAALTASFRRMLGEGFRVEVRLVEKIAQEKSGKYRFSICRI